MKQLFLVSLIFLFCSCQKELGNLPGSLKPEGWVSSGGEIFEDGTNPWFTTNTKSVRYCIVVDEQSISIKAAHAARLIKEGLDYWKSQFALMDSTGENTPFVGTQEFSQINCDGSEDLRFVIGYGALESQQRSYLSSKGQYVSIAVRTNYDRVRLKAKGFVYVASDLGPHRYPNGKQFVERAWSQEGLFFRVIQHELGHVFGLPHIGEGIMSEEYPEHIVRVENYENYSTKGLDKNFFFPQDSLRVCSLNKKAKEWFGVPAHLDCLMMSKAVNWLRKENAGNQVTVYATGTKVFTFIPIGKAVYKEGALLRVHVSRAGMMKLTPAQRVFMDPIYKHISMLPVSFFVRVDVGLDFESSSGQKKPFLFKNGPNGFEMIAEHKGKIETLVFHRRKCIGGGEGLMSLCLEP